MSSAVRLFWCITLEQEGAAAVKSNSKRQEIFIRQMPRGCEEPFRSDPKRIRALPVGRTIIFIDETGINRRGWRCVLVGWYSASQR
jgi:hypothetical protein